MREIKRTGREQSPGRHEPGNLPVAPIGELFPTVKPDRVRELMGTPTFQARVDILDLGNELRARRADGYELDRAVAIFERVHAPVLGCLYTIMAKNGYNRAEIKAAEWTHSGAVALPEVEEPSVKRASRRPRRDPWRLRGGSR